MHVWGDKDFDWDGLSKAINYIHKRLRKYGRIGVYSKEKWGTARISCYFVHSLYSLTHPGYVWYKYPEWLKNFDINYGYKLLKYTGLLFLIFQWQKFLYVNTYKNALKKWPHLRDELLCDADQLEWLEDAGLCKIEEYWTTHKT